MFVGNMNIVLLEKRNHLPLHDDVRWTCPPDRSLDKSQECHIRAFLEKDKTYVNIFKDDLDGEYRLNVSSLFPVLRTFRHGTGLYYSQSGLGGMVSVKYDIFSYFWIKLWSIPEVTF